MKSVKSILLVGVLFSITMAAAACGGPDLVVMEVSSPNLDGGMVKVRVKNQGDASAAACYLAVSVTPPGVTMKVFSPEVPALSAGQDIVVDAQTTFALSQADYEVIVDRSNTVKETNEKNNSLKGKFGGKP